MNILTFDIEEWFHILDFEEIRNEEQWSSIPSKVLKYRRKNFKKS